MAKLSANRAAKEAGVAKKTLLEAISSGRLSAEKNDKGHWSIDTAELFRVFPKTDINPASKTVSHPSENTTENKALEVEVEVLRERLKDKDDQIDDLRKRLDAESEERRKLTMMLTHREDKKHDKRGWFSGLFSKQETAA